MDIKRYINKNSKLILQIALIIVGIFCGIKYLNSYYENDEKIKLENNANENETTKENIYEIKDYGTKNDTVRETISSFVNYCNNKEIENAYKMLTTECKEEMFPTIDQFRNNYVYKIYNIKRTFEVEKWSSERNKATYLVTLHSDILATGGIDNYKQEFYTFVKDNNGNYKLNINNYIGRKYVDIKNTVRNITVKIEQIDVYEEYEKVKFTITNNTKKTIFLNGDKYNEKIYLKNSEGLSYSSLNSEFDNREIIMKPNTTQVFVVNFNKVYIPNDSAKEMVLSDVILDYEEYANRQNKINYSNRTSIKISY